MSTTDVPTSLADESVVPAFNISEEASSVKQHAPDAQVEGMTLSKEVVQCPVEELDVDRGDSTTIEEMRDVAVLLRKQLRMVENRIASLESTYLSLNRSASSVLFLYHQQQL